MVEESMKTISREEEEEEEEEENDATLKVEIQVNLPMEWAEELNRDEVTEKILEIIADYDANSSNEYFVTISGFRVKLTFACNGDVFIIPEELAEKYSDPEKIFVSMPDAWSGQLPVEAFQAMVINIMNNPNTADRNVTINGVSAEYHSCEHGYVWFFPIDGGNASDKLKLWCEKMHKSCYAPELPIM